MSLITHPNHFRLYSFVFHLIPSRSFVLILCLGTRNKKRRKSLLIHVRALKQVPLILHTTVMVFIKEISMHIEFLRSVV
jgi:hypothetical protein